MLCVYKVQLNIKIDFVVFFIDFFFIINLSLNCNDYVMGLIQYKSFW